MQNTLFAGSLKYQISKSASLGSSHYKIATQKAVKDYVDSQIAGENHWDMVDSYITPYIPTNEVYLKANQRIYSNSTDALIKNLSFYKSRGTYASPTVITSGDYLGETVFYGYDGTTFRRSGSIRYKNTGTVAGTRIAGQIEFWTSTDATPSVETLAGYIGTNGTLYWSNTVKSLTSLYVQRFTLITTSTDGFLLANSTASTSIVPVQMSPRVRFGANVWNTTGAGSAETSDWIIENLPTSGTTPSSLLKFGYSANGGSYSYPYTFSNSGAFTATLFNGLSIIGGASSVLDIAASKTVNIDTNFNVNTGDVSLIGNGLGNSIFFPTGTDILLGRASVDTITGLKTFQVNAIAATSTNGIPLVNNTLSTSGVPVQMSPRIRLGGHVWNTTATAHDETSDWIFENLPISGTTPTSIYRFGYSANGGSYTYPYNFYNNGDISFPLTYGARLGISSAEKIGLWGATPIAQPATNAYTSDPESSAYSGIDNLQVGTVYAQLSDLNILRVAYDNLRASYDDLLTKLKTTGIVA